MGQGQNVCVVRRLMNHSQTVKILFVMQSNNKMTVKNFDRWPRLCDYSIYVSDHSLWSQTALLAVLEVGWLIRLLAEGAG